MSFWKIHSSHKVRHSNSVLRDWLQEIDSLVLDSVHLRKMVMESIVSFGLSSGLLDHVDNLIRTLTTHVYRTDLAGADIIKFGMESKKSSTETSTHKFRLAIIDALREMRVICEAGKPNDKETSSKL